MLVLMICLCNVVEIPSVGLRQIIVTKHRHVEADGQKLTANIYSDFENKGQSHQNQISSLDDPNDIFMHV